ncbi:MAG: RidA family protein [Proteobacteria bacterium]|nr:RidA family protein [Pseudomonadota bacterium]
MRKDFINPPDSPEPRSYHHAVTVEGGRVIYLSGQVAFDLERRIVGENDLVAQTRQAFRNLQIAVEGGGGKLSDIVKLTIYVVNYKAEQMSAVTGVIGEFFPDESLPANSLIGVESLSTKGLLVEIEGIAVTDAP